jgi:hypothetical protein
MVPELDRLTAHEVELVYKAPMLVCILIAGADGTIDKKEIKGAIQFAEMKQQKSVSSVAALFHEVAKDFEDKVKVLMQQYPYELTQRNPLIIDELSELNRIWPKVDSAFAREFYTSLLNIAEKIASSSGGLLGIKSIGSEEAKYVKLPMIKNPSGGHA